MADNIKPTGVASHSWPFGGALGDVSCKIAYVVREVCKFASIFTLALLSVDRCLAGYHRLAALRTIGIGKTAVCAVWIACAVVAAPYLAYAGVRGPFGALNSTSCQLAWPSHRAAVVWTAFQFAVGFVAPSTVVLAAYAVLFRWLRRITRRRGRVTGMVTRPRRRMLHTVLVVVITFIVCQTPYYVLQWADTASERWPTNSSVSDSAFDVDNARPSVLLLLLLLSC